MTMRDAEIIELDDEPQDQGVPWRAGSLSLVVAPLVTVLVIASGLMWIGRSAPRSALPAATAEPSPPPRGTAETIVYTLPPGIIATRPPDATVTEVSGESGDPEMLENHPWTGLGPTFPGRGDVAEAVLQGDAYVIGGSGSAEDGRRVYRYDRRSGMRVRAADLPISLDHAMAATLGNRIYVLGGYEFGRPSARVFSLGANDSAWVEHSPMPAARAAGGAATLFGRIWIVGGVGADGGWIQDIWGWNGNAQWAHGLALLPTPRDHLAVGTYDGRICAAGGNGGERAFECYEPVRNEWRRMPDLRKPTIGARAAEVAGWFWVISQDVHIFMVDHWHFGPRLLTPRSGHAVVVIDDALYVIEGAPGIPTARMERLTPGP